jgi:hypothetical protein
MRQHFSEVDQPSAKVTFNPLEGITEDKKVIRAGSRRRVSSHLPCSTRPTWHHPMTIYRMISQQETSCASTKTALTQGNHSPTSE